MEMIIFCGIQATGKSSFYKENFFNSHVRVSLDLLNTRRKEDALLNTCLEIQQKMVIDNTNPTLQERTKYIHLGKLNKYKIIGYFFQSKLKESIARNNLREGKARIDKRGIIAASNKLEIPSYAEGFDELYFVSLISPNGFLIQNWKDEV